MRTLILGGTGDIGSSICSKLETFLGADIQAVGSADFRLQEPSEIESFFNKNGNDFDTIIHAAGYNKVLPIEDIDYFEFQYSWEANVLGFLQTVQKCLPYWKQRKHGRIIVIGSLYSEIARKNRLPYVMAKHSLFGAVQELALELAPYGVTVNMVSPGYIDTGLTRQNNDPETLADIISRIPLKRLGTPEDIAEVVAFLAYNGYYITGQNIVVDGGYSAGGFQK